MLIWVSCLMAGVSLWSVFWLLTHPVRQQRLPHPPVSVAPLVRVLWPWVHALATPCRPFVSWRMRGVLATRVRTAGLAAEWKPEHIAALQLITALLAAVLVGSSLIWQFSTPVPASVAWSALASVCGGLLPRRWLGQLGRLRQGRMLRELPFLLDMTTLCVEAGMNLQGALQQAARHGPAGPLRDELQHALADMRAGLPRQQALQQMAERSGLQPVNQLVTALGQADQLGMSLGPLLRAQAELRRSERFLRAEKLALEAPVKMLFPMVFCIFPCTFLIVGFPVAIKLMEAAW